MYSHFSLALAPLKDGMDEIQEKFVESQKEINRLKSQLSRVTIELKKTQARNKRMTVEKVKYVHCSRVSVRSCLPARMVLERERIPSLLRRRKRDT